MSFLRNLPFAESVSKNTQQVISNRWEEREAILQEEVNLFGWSRPIDQHIHDYLSKLLVANELAPIRLPVKMGELEERIGQARTIWDPYQPPTSNHFWEDVARITRDFLSFSREGRGTIHLKVVNNGACTKFHTDGYDLRLFTTYLGPGTEWLPEKAVNRRALGKSNEQIVRDDKLIQRLGTFHVGILKGEVPNSRSYKKGIVHRSPDLGDGEKRIIFRIDI